MNDTERGQWIDNDEGLYNWFREWKRGQHRSRQNQRTFIKENRAEIDTVISNITSGKQPQHYLAYGGRR